MAENWFQVVDSCFHYPEFCALVYICHQEISHIFREDNAGVDKLSSFDAQNIDISWWDSPPNFILQDSLGKNELPHYRFS